MHKLTPHPTWEIQDSSKVQTYMSCPRMYFYRYVLGWEREEPNIHLAFGTAWHKAMEHLLLHGYDQVEDAFQLFSESFDSEIPLDMQDSKSKNKNNALLAMYQYAEQYRHDDFNVLHTEIAGVVQLAPDKNMHLRLDAICEDKNGIFALEHKTGSKISRTWTDQWALKTQVGTYTHALYCLYEPADVFGVRINGTFFGAKQAEFMRLPIRKDTRSMNVWLWNTLYQLDEIANNFDLLSDCTEDDPILYAFPMIGESCTDYFGCPYHDFCTAWPNPLSRCGEEPIGFKTRWWNPKDDESKAKMVINLEAKTY